ncbi:Scr1 family TA system antitoxin-like transcriptional regulator [Streptomyces sp. NPDC051286]|uniref:Scr1 family TA system antitoxin-like transcriptional regulator n=1 Tax=Streptomyces sp. NPDC051286 TaxID=3365647 RepID=UPI0037A8034B
MDSAGSVSFFTNHHPALDDEEIEGRGVARMERQKLHTRRPAADIGFVLELHPLTRPTGGHQVCKKQLRHILDVAQLRNVQIQVMAPDRTTHAGLNGPFVLLETAERNRLAYVRTVADVQRMLRLLPDVPVDPVELESLLPLLLRPGVDRGGLGVRRVAALPEAACGGAAERAVAGAADVLGAAGARAGGAGDALRDGDRGIAVDGPGRCRWSSGWGSHRRC